jgi:putative ABC transport system permease protein
MGLVDANLAIRSLIKNFRFYFFGFFGLSIAFSGAALIYLIVYHEYSYERWLPGVEDLAIVTSIVSHSGVEQPASLTTQYLLAPQVAGRVQGVENVARSWDRGVETVLDDHADIEGYTFVDPAFFDIFQFPAIEGDPASALSRPNVLVVSDRYALEWFGQTRGLIGRTIRLRFEDGLRVFTIGAVIDEPPGPSHFRPTAYAQLNRSDWASLDVFDNWGSNAWRTYLQIAPESDLAGINEGLNAIFRSGAMRQFGTVDDLGFASQYEVVRLTDLRLNAAQLRSTDVAGDRVFVVFLASVGVVILGIAIANYVALFGAIASRRLKEFALKRVLGGASGRITAHFFLEASLFCAACGIAAVAIIAFVLPILNAALGQELTHRPLITPTSVAICVSIILLAAALAVLGPGVTVARLNPAQILAGGGAGARVAGLGFRSTVMTGQYAIATALIILTLTSLLQLRALDQAELNFEPGGLIALEGIDRPEAQSTAVLLDTLRSAPGVAGVALGSHSPATQSRFRDDVMRAGSTVRTLQRQSVGPDYFVIYATPLLTGRGFDAERVEDIARMGEGWRPEINIMLNESAARELGFDAPSLAIGQTLNIRDQASTGRIIGVVADQRFNALNQPVEPTYYVFDPDMFNNAVIRVADVDLETAISRIERAWRALNPDLAVQLEPVERVLWDFYGAERRRAAAFAGFSILAIALASLGALALSAFSAERHGREMAIRRIVGASAADVAALHIRRALLPALAGAAIAIPIALAIAERWLAGFDTRIHGTPFLSVAALFAIVLLAILATSTELPSILLQRPARRLKSD